MKKRNINSENLKKRDSHYLDIENLVVKENAQFFFFFNLIYYLFIFTSISPTCVNDTRTLSHLCVYVYAAGAWQLDSFLHFIFFPFVSSSIWLSYFSLLFSNSICFAYFFIWLALVGAWYFGTEECVYILFFFVLCACVLCVTFLCLSLFILFYFSHGNLSLLFYYWIAWSSRVAWFSLVCLFLSFLNSSFKLWLI